MIYFLIFEIMKPTQNDYFSNKFRKEFKIQLGGRWEE